MCSHYQAIKERERYFKQFGVFPPQDIERPDMWPGYRGLMVRRPTATDPHDEAAPSLEILPGVFGLLPHWAKELKLARSTYNARSETAAEKPSFREAWRKAQHCIVPAEAFFEPDWQSGKAVPTRISRADGEPMGIAGLWSWWRPPGGEPTLSFTMLTINADPHPLMRNLHKPGGEKRMPVILPRGAYEAWLDAPAHASMTFMQACAAHELVANVAPS
ncbi:SOS response-associated peptidase [Rhodoferax sp.]|uniref:SOS response-associated peptidase n=1 Tax=Rhodoferax sp. TaxID=50421 RepID=UPI002743E913|nr:SOS response-associated peptidase [Rhodoferax sp.]